LLTSHIFREFFVVLALNRPTVFPIGSKVIRINSRGPTQTRQWVDATREWWENSNIYITGSVAVLIKKKGFVYS
jgi:hypothetical protein